MVMLLRRSNEDKALQATFSSACFFFLFRVSFFHFKFSVLQRFKQTSCEYILPLFRSAFVHKALLIRKCRTVSKSQGEQTKPYPNTVTGPQWMLLLRLSGGSFCSRPPCCTASMRLALARLCSLVTVKISTTTLREQSGCVVYHIVAGPFFPPFFFFFAFLKGAGPASWYFFSSLCQCATDKACWPEGRKERIKEGN